MYGDGAAALVEPRPEQAPAVPVQRPTAGVGGTTHVVEADHLGAHLGQRHPGERTRDEARRLDDAESGQWRGHLVHRCAPWLAGPASTVKCQSRTGRGSLLVLPSVGASASTTERRSTIGVPAGPGRTDSTVRVRVGRAAVGERWW